MEMLKESLRVSNSVLKLEVERVLLLVDMMDELTVHELVTVMGQELVQKMDLRMMMQMAFQREQS